MKPEDLLELDFRIEFPKFSLEILERIALQGVTALVGESGAGKSTMLRVIAGIERSGQGTVRFRGRTWMDSEAGVFVPAYKRAVGIVFQEGRLFSHLDVRGNLNYGFRRNANRDGPNWDDVCQALDLEPLITRRVQKLSGGEQQRVALGRALVSAPSLLLLDEPLASLDSDSKDEIIPYLRRVILTFGIPAIYVTHSREELRTLVDNMLIVDKGRIVGRGSEMAGPGHRQLLKAVMGKPAGKGLAYCMIGDSKVLARYEHDVTEGSAVMLAFLDTDMTVSTTHWPATFSAGRFSGSIAAVEPGNSDCEARVTAGTAGGQVRIAVYCVPEERSELIVGREIEIAFVRPPHVMC